MRIQEVDTIKGLAILGVLFAHMSFTNRFDETVLNLVNVLQIVFGWCVIAFFYASGFVLNISNKNNENIYVFIKKRLHRLIIPLFIFSLSYKLILFLLYLIGMSSARPDYFSSMYNIFLFLFEPVGPQFYFLPFLFVVSIGIELLRILFASTTIHVISMISFVLVYIFLKMPDQGYGSSLNLLPFYLTAYLLGILDSNKKSKEYYVYLIGWIIIIFISSYVYYSLVPLYLLVPSVLFWTFKKINIFNKIILFSKLGVFSSSIYVWHAPIIMPFSSIIAIKIFDNSYMVFGATLVSTIIFTYLMHFIVNYFKFMSLYKF